MTTLREAAQQALEALESVDWYVNQLEEIVYSADDAGTHEERAKAQPAIAALRAALAQQAEPEPQDAELSAALGWPGGISDPVLDRKVLLQKVAALKAQPEPAQEAEPYAWHYTNIAGVSVWHRGPSTRLDADMQAARDYPRAHKVTPLYTGPLQRPPLTDEEIKECLPPDAVRLPPGWAQFARAVERKVRGEA